MTIKRRWTSTVVTASLGRGFAAGTAAPSADSAEQALARQILDGAGGNAVSHDTIVAPPRHLQWVGSPAWSRHHALVKCGMRRKQGLIIQEPSVNGESASQTLDAARVDETRAVLAAVDLDARQVSRTVHGQTVQTESDGRLDAIKFIGYCANSVTSEFSAVAVSGQ